MFYEMFIYLFVFILEILVIIVLVTSCLKFFRHIGFTINKVL